jgi:protein-L-isoaspartate(D-aspartate) O-methyltransferase
MANEAILRERMVNNQLRTFDVTDHRVQDAFATIPRELFVPAAQRPFAYSDEAIPFGPAPDGGPPRIMTPPAVLARLIQLAEITSDDVALVVGALTGYSTAVVAALSNSVLGLECDEQLAGRASDLLEQLDVQNAAVVDGPLPQGWPDEAPFDVIVVDGAVETGLDTLFAQLKDGGRLTVVEGLGLGGRARRYLRAGDAVSGWSIFNAAAPLLPGFERAMTFEFD